MGQFIAEKEIMGVTVEEGEKTPGGEEMVKVIFVDSSFEIMPKKRLTLTCSDNASDASTVQKTIQQQVGATLYGVLHEFGIKYGEVEEILNSVSQLTNNGYMKARDIVFGIKHEFLPLNEINKILVKNHNVDTEKDNNGVDATGSGSNPKN